MMLPVLAIATLSMACGQGGPDGDPILPAGSTGTTGSTTGSTTAVPTGVAGLRGSAVVQPVGKTFSYTGTEELYWESTEGDLWCSVQSDVSQVELGIAACDGCDWSFSLQTSGSAAAGGCSDVDVGSYDDVTFSYGFIQGKKGYGTLAYYYDGYGWYGTYADASWDSSTGDFQYDWPMSDLYGSY